MGLQAACVRWLKGRTNLEKVLMPISIVLLFTSILLIVVGFGYKRNSKEDGEKSLCLSAECYQTTGEILSMTEQSVDPCTDFYDYACGKFVATHSVPVDHYKASMEERSSDSIRLHLKHWLESPAGRNNASAFKKARDLYTSCMDYGSQENKPESLILRLLKEEVNGEWPSLDASWESPSLSQEKFLSSLTSLGIAVIFQLDIFPDSSNSSKYIVRISPGSPFLLQHQKNELRSNRFLRSYLVSALTLLGMNDATVRNSVENMLEIDYRFFLVKEQADKECGQRDEIKDDRGTRRVSLKELDNLMKTEVSWTAILEDVLSTVDKSAVSAVDVYCQHYVRQYVQLLYGSGFNEGQIYNYLATRFFLTFISHLSPSFNGIHRNYIARYSTPELRPFKARWKECVFLLEKYMLPVIATAYAQGVSSEVQEEGKKVLLSAKSSFQDVLPTLSWTEENKREWIKQKISKLDFEIALMEYSQNVSKLDKLFLGLQLHPDCLICNILKLQRYKVANRLQKLISPKEPDSEWQSVTLMTPEHYQHSEGILRIHFDKVVPPFLRLHQPNFLNYGKFGFFLSRELVHYAFSSGQISQKLKACLTDQYSRHKIEETSLKVDGLRTLEENFVDNLSLLIAFEAYEKSNKGVGAKKLPGLHLSNHQKFFLSFAQVFCEVRDSDGYGAYINSTFAPSKVRVNTVLKNSKKFSEAYSCAVDSPMNPLRKCDF